MILDISDEIKDKIDYEKISNFIFAGQNSCKSRMKDTYNSSNYETKVIIDTITLENEWQFED